MHKRQYIQFLLAVLLLSGIVYGAGGAYPSGEIEWSPPVQGLDEASRLVIKLCIPIINEGTANVADLVEYRLDDNTVESVCG